jgi:protein SCO1/2
MQLKPTALNVLLALSLLITSCQEKKNLPFLGPKDTRVVAGKVDTIYHQIPAFRFLNQDSVWVSEKIWLGKFTSPISFLPPARRFVRK